MLCNVYVAQGRLALKMNQNDNHNHLSYLLECATVCTACEEYIKACSLIYMRHGLLATDAGVISPTHNYTDQQQLFCMDDSQLQIQISPLCLLSDTGSANSTYIPSSSSWRQTNLWHTVEFSLSCLYFFFFPFHIFCLEPANWLIFSPQLISCLPSLLTFSLQSFLFPDISLSPHPAPQSLSLIGIRHAVGDKVWTTRGSVILAHCHCPMSQHRYSPSNPPARFIPPALGPHSKQSPGQALHAQTWESWPHSKPHMRGPSLTGSPGSSENQFSLLLGAVQQTYLEDSRKAGREQGREETHTHIHTSEIRRGQGRHGEIKKVGEVRRER